MSSDLGRPLARPRPSAAFALLALTALACGGGGGAGCTTCPGEVETGALRLTLDYDSPAGSLAPAGFRPQDVRRVDIVIQGSEGEERLSLTPPLNAAFLTLPAGLYGVVATAVGDAEVLLFHDETNVTVVEADTVNLALDLDVALGAVGLTVGGVTEGRVDARAGDAVPLAIVVTNTAGRGVPGALVELVPSPAGYATIELANGGRTDAGGNLQGTIDAPHSGELMFSLLVDGHPVDAGSGMRVAFATGVTAGASSVTTPSQILLMANGTDFAEYEVTVRNRDDEILPGVPVVVSSSRNVGIESEVDVLQPLPGFESGKTDEAGVFRFQLRSTTSSFIRLDSEGRLFSPPQAGFVPSEITVTADGVIVGVRTMTFNSTVDPRRGGLTIAPQFLPANGQASALITVEAQRMGGQPVPGAYVELVNIFGESQNHLFDIRPEPGFDGFRTNEQGIWRGRIRSTVKKSLLFLAKVDGRVISTSERSVFFQ